MQLLRTSNILDGVLTGKISDKIKGEPYPAKSTTTEIKREPQIIYKYLADTEKKWVKFCLVQLDFSVEPQSPDKEFGYVLKESETKELKNKVFKALDIARENNVDVICFPELSFAKEWVKEIKNEYKDIIIIGGSYYDQEYNICPIIIDGECIVPPYMKYRPSPFENPQTTGHGMKSGNILYIFQTKCGRFSVLTCIDYTDQSYRICRYEDNGVNFIINPCYDPNILRSQPRCNSDCTDWGIDVIQVNKAEEGEKYSRSCIIGKEHKYFLDKLKNEGFKPQDNINYKLFQLNGEMIGIAELNIRIQPPVDVDINYSGRIKLRKEKCYKYKNGGWLPLSNK